MIWKKKKRAVWACFVVASAITLVGLAIHPAMYVAGMGMLAVLAIFCTIDRD